MKILDIVKFNSGVAFVVDKMPVLTYEKMVAPTSACEGEYEKFAFAGREFLIGSDESGVFYDVLYHRKESGPKAFGGHVFSHPLKDGGTFTTDGWWWDGGSTVAARMPGLGENTFKARYQRPEKQGDVGWKGLAAVPWRESREEAQTDLDQLAEKKGWAEWNG